MPGPAPAAERHEVAAQHDHLGVQHARQGREAEPDVATHRGQPIAGGRVGRRACGHRPGGLVRGVELGQADRGQHRVQADRGLPAASPSAAAPGLGVADRHVSDLAGESGAAGHEPPVGDDAGADAHGAREVERVPHAHRGTVVRLGVRRAVGVVADPHRTAREHPLETGGQPGAAHVEVGRPGDGAVVVAHQPGHGDRGADEPAARAPGRPRAARRPATAARSRGRAHPAVRQSGSRSRRPRRRGRGRRPRRSRRCSSRPSPRSAPPRRATGRPGRPRAPARGAPSTPSTTAPSVPSADTMVPTVALASPVR